jgi:hypothetical protein
MVALPRNTPTALRDIALVLTTCFTGLRMQDLERICERNIEQKAMDPQTKAPRRFEFTLEVMKTNLDGTKILISEAPVMVPCICMTAMDNTELKAFKKQLKAQWDCACATECPYSIVRAYQNSKPERQGSRSSETTDKTAPGDMAYARATTTRGEPRELVRGKLGINELRKIPERVSQLLTPGVRPSKKVTGHAGRHTLVTEAMNAGVDSVTVAAASKHKDPATLKGYLRADAKLLCGAALGIGAKLLSSSQTRSTPKSSFASSEDDSDGEPEKENHAAHSSPTTHQKRKAEDSFSESVSESPASNKPATKKATTPNAAQKSTSPTAAKKSTTPTGAKKSTAANPAKKSNSPTAAKKSTPSSPKSCASESEMESGGESTALKTVKTRPGTPALAAVSKRKATPQPATRRVRFAGDVEDDDEDDDCSPESAQLQARTEMNRGSNMKRFSVPINGGRSSSSSSSSGTSSASSAHNESTTVVAQGGKKEVHMHFHFD